MLAVSRSIVAGSETHHQIYAHSKASPSSTVVREETDAIRCSDVAWASCSIVF